MLLFVVARSRLDRYEELRRHFEEWRDVRVVLDRREGSWNVFGGRPAATGTTPSARCRARNEEAGLVRGRHRQSRFVIQCPFSPTSKSSSVIIARTARLTGDATAVARNGYLLTAACPCGVVIER